MLSTLRTFHIGPFSIIIIGGTCFSLLSLGCATTTGMEAHVGDAPLRVLVGPVILEAPITKSTQIYSFEEAPQPEVEPALLAQLKDEVQIKAQRLLIEHLSRQERLKVVPFDETRRMLADIGRPAIPLSDAQLDSIRAQSGADLVLTPIIHDYGPVRWQYWAGGWVLHATLWTVVIGATTAWNPAAIGAYLAFDATTDLPVWYGGAYIFGWAFRPVRVHLDAVQLGNCRGLMWTEEELAIKVPGKTLESYPVELRERKEIQLEVNLNRAMAELAESAGHDLKLQSCMDNGKPEKIDNFSFLSLLDHLIH